MERGNNGNSRGLTTFTRGCIAEEFRSFVLRRLTERGIPGGDTACVTEGTVSSDFLKLLPGVNPGRNRRSSLVRGGTRSLCGPGVLRRNVTVDNTVTVSTTVANNCTSKGSLLMGNTAGTKVGITPGATSFLGST